MAMKLSRRTVLAATAGVAAATGLAGCGSGGGAGAGGDGPVRFAFWGSDFYIDLTNQLIEAFQTKNSDITVEGEPGAFAAYWDRLGTQVAGQDAPDVINMDGKYLAEYASRGVLADLSSTATDLSGLSEADLAAGTVDGTVRAASTGSNSWLIFTNPSLFHDAGLEVPDDTTWTWDDLYDLGKQISDNSNGDVVGISGGGSYADLTIFLRQFGQDFFSPDGLGYDEATLTQWYEWYLRITEGGVSPAAQVSVEESSLSIEQQLFAQNKAAMTWVWSNNLAAVRKASGHDDIVMLRPPSHTGVLADNGAYLKATMYWSINDASQSPEAAAKLVDFLLNDPDAAKIQLLNRGVPSNPDTVAAMEAEFTTDDTDVADMIAQLGTEIATPPAIQPTGTSEAPTVLTRHLTDVWFKRQTPAEAAAATTQELQEMIKAAG